MLKKIIVLSTLLLSLFALAPVARAQAGPIPVIFVPVVVGWAIRAGGRVVPVIRMVRAGPHPARQAPVRQAPMRSPAEQARRAEIQRRLDRAGNALDVADALDRAINNPLGRSAEEYKNYVESRRRLDIARINEQRLDRLARTVHPDSINADRIYQQAAEASRQRARIQSEVQQRGPRYSAAPRGSSPSNSDGINRQAKGDSWADRQRDNRPNANPPGRAGNSGGGGNSPSIFDNRREKDKKPDLVGPKFDSNVFDNRPNGKPSEFSKEKRQPRDTFTKN